MLSKTAKKKDATDKNKCFIVTESGLVEDRGSVARHKVKEHKSLLDSVSDSVKETSRRASVMAPGEKVQSLPPVEKEKVERSPSLKFANLATAKTQFGNLLSKRRMSSRYGKFKFLLSLIFNVFAKY